MFEIHLTVQTLSLEEIDAFISFCKEIAVKPIIIELEAGVHTQQPMISKVYKDIEASQLQEEIDALIQLFESNQYEIKRVKVEVPLDFIEEGKKAFPEYRGHYFEWHGKIEHPNFEKLRQSVVIRNAHLSRNSLKNHSNQRFVTVRDYGNLQSFHNNVTGIKHVLMREKATLVKDEYEYCVFDSNKSLDKDWLDIPEITDYHYLHLLAFEGFLRRLVERGEKFILKGSILTRQCISDKSIRHAGDLDFLYGEYIDNDDDAGKLFSKWVTHVTETPVEDLCSFRSFRENDFWRGIDYAMDDDFPTTNTDILCHVNGQEVEFGLDISWNLPLEAEPVPLYYEPEQGEAFIVPYTVPIPVQIAWKLHQSIVRPRSKDFLDVILLFNDNDLRPDELEQVLMVFRKECKKDRIDPKRLNLYIEGKVSAFLKSPQYKTKASQGSYQHVSNPLGFELLPYNLDINVMNTSFKIEDPIREASELVERFEACLVEFFSNKEL